MKRAHRDIHILGKNPATRRAISRRTMQIFDTRVLWNAKHEHAGIYIFGLRRNGDSFWPLTLPRRKNLRLCPPQTPRETNISHARVFARAQSDYDIASCAQGKLKVYFNQRDDAPNVLLLLNIFFNFAVVRNNNQKIFLKLGIEIFFFRRGI